MPRVRTRKQAVIAGIQASVHALNEQRNMDAMRSKFVDCRIGYCIATARCRTLCRRAIFDDYRATRGSAPLLTDHSIEHSE